MELREKCRLYESWLRAIDKHARFDVWFKDAESRYLYVNESFEHAMGMDRERLLGAAPGDIFSDPEREGRVLAMDQKVMDQGELQRVIPCDGSGSLQMHEEYRFPVEDAEGKVTGLGCFAIEVSERSFAEEALNQAQQIAKLGSWRWSIKDKCLISCSDQFAELLGCSVTEVFTLMQHRLDRVVHPDDRHILERLHNRSSRDEHAEYRIEYRIIQRTGEVRYVVEIAQPLYGNAGEPIEYAGTLQDITAQKQVEDELREAKGRLEHRVAQRTKHLKYLASHDSLTGLLNRTGYYDYLQDQLADAPESQEIAVIVLDLDGFKLVNDTYGHAAGDKVLKVVARRLQKSLKRDDLIARLGGDEFVLFLKDLDSPSENARSICNRLRKVVCAPIAVGNLEIRVGCSAGISFITRGEGGKDQFEKAIAHADIALYRAKSTSGVYCTVFEAAMGSEVARQQRLENDLRAAIDERAISVDYQPQVCLNSRRVLAIEALCRWHHKDLGPIAPNVFIPIAEQCGLINQLSQIVLEQACADMLALQSHARDSSDIRLAVNFSVAQFYDEDLLSSIARVLQKYGLPASNCATEKFTAKRMSELSRAWDCKASISAHACSRTI
ncbi:MAG: diguanylate cyclase [Pseudomonadota bacterium]